MGTHAGSVGRACARLTAFTATAAVVLALAHSSAFGDAPGSPSGTCPGANVVPTPGELAQARAATLCLVNVQRAAAGLAPLRDNRMLDRAASGHTLGMIRSGSFEHEIPGSAMLERRLRRSGYLAHARNVDVAENLGEGTAADATPAAMVESWMDSPDHRALMLSPDFQDSGIAIAAKLPASFDDGTPGATYTQDFGARG